MTKSKILCLHGTQTSGEVLIQTFPYQIFRLQLGQLSTRLEQEQNVELYFVDGLIETDCHDDMHGMFWGPYYTWCSMSSKDTLVDYESAEKALDFIQDIIAEEGPFDGIMGFSQGAVLALALLLRHATDHPLDPAYAICKFAILFSCVGIEAEQWDAKLSIPSLHIFDKTDGVLSTLAVEHCEPGSAKVVPHHFGHVIPRDKTTVNGILDAIQDLQHRAMML